MITVTLGNIFQGTKILMSLTDSELTAKAGYKLNKIIDACLAELPKVEKGHNELVIKYANGTEQVTDENKDLFIQELNEFLNTETELNGKKLL